jgi:hypothetical protein
VLFKCECYKESTPCIRTSSRLARSQLPIAAIRISIEILAHLRLPSRWLSPDTYVQYREVGRADAPSMASMELRALDSLSCWSRSFGAQRRCWQSQDQQAATRWLPRWRLLLARHAHLPWLTTRGWYLGSSPRRSRKSCSLISEGRRLGRKPRTSYKPI